MKTACKNVAHTVMMRYSKNMRNVKQICFLLKDLASLAYFGKHIA